VKESEQARITHVLESAEGVENQDSEKSKLPRDTHSLGNADEGIDQESKGKRASEGHSRTRECRGCGQVRDGEQKRASEGHSLPGGRRRRTSQDRKK